MEELWVEVAEYNNWLHPNLARGRLESEGIEVFLMGENLLTGEHILPLIMKVPKKDYPYASAILNEIQSEIEMIEKRLSPRCLFCMS